MANHPFPQQVYGQAFASQVVPAGTHATMASAQVRPGMAPPLSASMHPGSAPVPSPVPPSPYSLAPGRDEDVALYRDARIAFSHLLPGRPTLAVARPFDPTADVLLELRDAPITVRYKLDVSGRGASSPDLARATAERFSSWRAQASTRVDFANPSWLLAWGVEAAALTSYDVAPAADQDLAHEDLFVLYREGSLLLVTWTYPRNFIDDPTYAAFASVAEATMVWDPNRWEQRGRIWPESAIVRAGMSMPATPKYTEAWRWLRELSLHPDERRRGLEVLSSITSNVGAPWVELQPDALERSRIALVSAFRSPELQAFFRSAFAEVRTAHDLRGLAVLVGRALDTRLPPVRPPQMKHLVRG